MSGYGAAGALQAAVFARLAADAEVQAATGGAVYDAVPGGVVAATANGYTLGPLMGFRAAEMAAGRPVPKTLERFSLARF